MPKQQLAKKEPGQSALVTMASRLNVDATKLHGVLKETAFKKASDAEMMALCIVSNEYGLNPLTKEIYAFPAKGGGIVPVVSIDGWLRIINEHPQMDGMEATPTFSESGELESYTCSIWRKDRSKPTVITEYLSECRRSTEPWKMEHRMLRHKAIIQCGRVAMGFSGIVDEDDAQPMRNITPQEQEAPRLKIDPFNEEEEKEPEAPPKCDGNHRGSICGADECWLMDSEDDDGEGDLI